MSKVIDLRNHPGFKVEAPPDDDKKKGRKPKGMRKDGRIKRTFTDGKRPDGKPNEISFYGATVAEAEAKRDAYKSKVEVGIDMAKKEVTVAAWLEEWRAAYKCKLGASAAKSLSSYIKRINDSIGQMKLADVRNIHLQGILNKMDGMSTSSVRSVRQIMTGAFKAAVSNRYILFNPSDGLTMPDTTEGSHRQLETWEVEIVLNQWRIHRFGRIVKTLMLTGMRPGEAVAITWDKMDMGGRRVIIDDAATLTNNQPVNRGKTKTEAGVRIVPMCDELFKVLNETPEGERKGYVFRSAHGVQLTASALERGLDGYLYVIERYLNGEDVTKQQTGRPHKKNLERARDDAQREAWKKHNEKVDLWLAARKRMDINLYDLRHTFCTALYDADVDVKTASYFMGHKDIETTLRIYTHLTEERSKRGAAKMVSFLNGWKPLSVEKNGEADAENETSERVKDGIILRVRVKSGSIRRAKVRK